MPNFTDLPERHYVDKAKRLSLGGKDSDTYFDGETLETMLNAIEELQEKISSISVDSDITFMQIRDLDDEGFRVDANYTELVNAIRNRTPIICKVYNPFFTSPSTQYYLAVSTREDFEEFVVVGEQIDLSVNNITINRVEVTFPPTTGTPHYSIKITSKQLPVIRTGTFVLSSTLRGQTSSWTYYRVGNIVRCIGDLTTFDGLDVIFTNSWTGLPFTVSNSHCVTVSGNNHLASIQLSDSSVTVKNYIDLSSLSISSTTATSLGTIEFSYITTA